MSTALIGYTGFVGGTIAKQCQFDQQFNSKNIEDIKGQNFDLIVCAGAPGVKWLANQKPAEDKASIERLQSALTQVHTNHFILISTVDVFSDPIGVTEDTMIAVEDLSPYGEHRFLLEQFVATHFPSHTIVRLPGLFGAGLKKNLIFDIINKQRYDAFHPDSTFQFYNMERIWNDLKVAHESSLPLIHLAVEPVTAFEVAETVHEGQLLNNRELQSIHYDFRTKYADLFGSSAEYIDAKDSYLPQIGELIRSERELLS